MISNKAGLQHIAELFIREGVEHIIISPGSRNAPMMLTFPEYEEFKCYSIIDERSAGFIALGIAQKTKKPVVLNCTSGSALLNYAPAIAEAYYQNIPLIVLSADRPENLIDRGDGQCIKQKDVFHNIIRKSFHLPENPKSEAEITIYQNKIIEAINTSLSPFPGPVHINVPLAEPIYTTHEKKDILLIKNSLKTLNAINVSDKINSLKKTWAKVAKKLIIIGQQAYDAELNHLLSKLLERGDTVVLSESTSNISAQGTINNIDRVLSQINEENELNFLPSILITIGGHIVSKKIKAFLRTASDYEHWHIGLNSQANDTFFHLKNQIQSPAKHILTDLLETDINRDNSYSSLWKKATNNAELLHQQFINKSPYSDLLVFESIRKSIPKTAINLHFSNSTPIRYSQLFNYNENTHIDCNRGVSGIDGSISTALGASFINDTKTCIITGDLSFFYDSNSLWNNYLHADFRIIVINNGGGGIFRFIDGPMQSKHLDYFETTHQRSAKSIAIESGLTYTSCIDISDLELSLLNFFEEQDKGQLLEIFTPREVNDKILKDYFSFLKKGIL